MLRLSPPDNERITRGATFSKQAGGAELNSAAGAAMLGLRCGIISKLPANDLGIYIKNNVRLSGVSALKNTIPGDLICTDRKEIESINKEHKVTGRIAEMDR